MGTHRTERLRELGQSVWLDIIRRGQLISGEFERAVREDGVVGVTSNPTIFQLAISESNDYDTAIQQGIASGLDGAELFESLAVEDIRLACDRLRPTFEQTGGLDGRVSLEVNPHLSQDTAGTVTEARRLAGEVDRENLMIKVPATAEGLPAIATLTAEGLSINITLIFSLARYEQVMEAYLSGLERRVAAGGDLRRIRSVASFFVSRVDTKVDAAIEQALPRATGADQDRLAASRGKAAVANARLAYARFREVFASPRFTKLAAHGATLQRPLWASTSTKNKAYRDVLYVEELIGPDTVNTMPPQTLAAFNDHGTVEVRIDRDLDQAHELFASLPQLGIPLETLIAQLEAEGVATFTKSYDSLLEALATKRREMVA
jgi:transaldolase/glucose-6-phosphate isomerase